MEPDQLRFAIDWVKQQPPARVNRGVVFRMSVMVSRALDQAVAKCIVPPYKDEVLEIVKQVYNIFLVQFVVRKDDVELKSALLALLLSFKGAVHTGWFNVSDVGELLRAADELLEPYRGESATILTSNPDANTKDVKRLVQGILSRTYPWITLQKIYLCVEAKSGYEVLTCDFNIVHRQEIDHMRLLAIRRDKTETSACLVTPPEVSFVLNGCAIDKRSIPSVDNRPQAPSDCSGLVKCGINILQIVGEFQAPYTIIVASTSTSSTLLPLLEKSQPVEELQERVVSNDGDDDIIEGPSKVSLRCPISRKRIATPVKGKTCKHLQCFDYESYLKINRIRPLWRCPHCNAYVNCDDLLLVNWMAEILRQVDEATLFVVVASDGTWTLDNSQDAKLSTRQNPNVVVLSDDEADFSQTATDRRPVSFRPEPVGDQDKKPEIHRGISNDCSRTELLLPSTSQASQNRNSPRLAQRVLVGGRARSRLSPPVQQQQWQPQSLTQQQSLPQQQQQSLPQQQLHSLSQQQIHRQQVLQQPHQQHVLQQPHQQHVLQQPHQQHVLQQSPQQQVLQQPSQQHVFQQPLQQHVLHQQLLQQQFQIPQWQHFLQQAQWQQQVQPQQPTQQTRHLQPQQQEVLSQMRQHQWQQQQQPQCQISVATQTATQFTDELPWFISSDYR